MDRRLQLTYLCLAIFLLVLPLVCSKDEEDNGMNDMGELLQKLLKAEKERRQMPDDTNVDGSGGTEQTHTNDGENKPDIVFEKKPGGVNENDVKEDGELTQKIIQDCENKYELILDKGEDKAKGTCYLHKMSDVIYQKNCNGSGTGGEVEADYELGPKIEDGTLLPKIKGIEGCMGKSVYELIPKSVKTRGLDEYEKRKAEARGCYYCYWYAVSCKWVCAQKAGWWWGEYCAHYLYQCDYSCYYSCG